MNVKYEVIISSDKIVLTRIRSSNNISRESKENSRKNMKYLKLRQKYEN